MVIHYDSQLVANQLTWEYTARNERLGAYMKLPQKLFKGFCSAYIERFPRASNNHVDALATLASAIESNLKKKTIEIKFLPRPSIKAYQNMGNYLKADLGGNWMDPIIQYLIDGTISKDNSEANRLKPSHLDIGYLPIRFSTSGPTQDLN